MYLLLLISVFGLIGILLRYGIDHYFFKMNSQFPFTTLMVNLIGSFLAGVIYAWSVTDKNFSLHLQTALLVGFCGGFTTFSAFTLQSLQMLEKGKFLPTIFYMTLSPLLGLAVAFLPLFALRKL